MKAHLLTGKTVLASVIIDQLIADSATNGTAVAYFYCGYGDNQRNSFLSIARSLLWQLSKGIPDLISHLHRESCESGQEILTSLNLAQELLQLVFNYATQNQTIYIVLDGLDECERDERKIIATWIQSFSESLAVDKRNLFRCLFVSQDDGVARKDFKHISRLKLVETHTRRDIEAYASFWHRKIEEKFGKLEASEPNITKIVTAAAQGRVYPTLPLFTLVQSNTMVEFRGNLKDIGMFLFAKLMILHLKHQPSMRDLLQELEPGRLPVNLDQL